MTRANDHTHTPPSGEHPPTPSPGGEGWGEGAAPRHRTSPRFLAIAVALALIASLAIWATFAPGSEHEIGCYMTSLEDRSRTQVHNVALATRSINNTVLQPGQTFSFVKVVNTWTADRGYLKAPVSYDGELVRSWGGGVCQASTTLYNAALLAGLDIVERHRHHWPARYAPLGRDAAVAYSDIDLKFRNNLPCPVRIVGRVEGNRLIYRILSTHRTAYRVRIESQTRSVTLPSEVLQDRTTSGRGRWKLINRGHPGFYVVTYRTFLYQSSTRRQLLSEDRYPAMNRIVRIAER